MAASGARYHRARISGAALAASFALAALGTFACWARPAFADATPAPSPSPAPSASTQASPTAQAATPTPLNTPTLPPPSTPEPVFITPTPAAQDFPHTGSVVAPQASFTPGPSGNAASQPTPGPLPSGLARVTADQLYGNNSPTGGFTAYGHVHLEYADAVVTADQAVYDATTKVLRATGHVTLTESDGDTATASALEYHSDSDQVEMFDVEGSTGAIYFQGEQIQGRLYYKGKEAILDPDGHTIIMNGWVTTCDPSHPAYHIRGREIEIRPHDRLIAHGSALYLGNILVAALGILALPLSEAAARQNSEYAPRVGYNSAYGFFIRNFINFYRGPNWYGTYHVDFYQKVGIGLGADLFFSRADGRGNGELSVYNLNNNAMQQQLTGTRNTTQATLNMERLFSSHLSGAIAFSYSGQSAIFTALPTTTSTNISITHTGARSTTSYVVTDTATGPSHSFGGILQHTIAFSPYFSQTVGLNLQDSTNPNAFSRAIGFNADTHVIARAFDADLVISTNHGLDTVTSGATQTTTPVIGIQRVPELTIRAHPFQITNLRLPISLTLIDGDYDDGYDDIETSRLEFDAQVGPGIVRIGNDALFNATATVRQDAYGTGDLQGTLNYQATLQDFFDHHADNTLIYTAQSVRGYTPMPSLDRLTPANQIAEVLNLYNGPWYRFTASTSYNFEVKQLSTVNYQLNVSPNPYAYLSLGTSYNPGSGYTPVVIQMATPLSRVDYLQFSGDYDFTLHGLQGQNWFLSHTVGNCYVVQVAYHQPLKEVDVSLGLLAFPNQFATFGINNNGPIIAQGFGD
ncbi:MAG TPA: hypothetical protein VEJ41_09360 [Candidatus Acidoferrales bacterium]|nr:hypothetical protein [Candidatus Acidoferrales bacterium]